MLGHSLPEEFYLKKQLKNLRKWWIIEPYSGGWRGYILLRQETLWIPIHKINLLVIDPLSPKCCLGFLVSLAHKAAQLWAKQNHCLSLDTRYSQHLQSSHLLWPPKLRGSNQGLWDCCLQYSWGYSKHPEGQPWKHCFFYILGPSIPQAALWASGLVILCSRTCSGIPGHYGVTYGVPAAPQPRPVVTTENVSRHGHLYLQCRRVHVGQSEEAQRGTGTTLRWLGPKVTCSCHNPRSAFSIRHSPPFSSALYTGHLDPGSVKLRSPFHVHDTVSTWLSSSQGECTRLYLRE